MTNVDEAAEIARIEEAECARIAACEAAYAEAVQALAHTPNIAAVAASRSLDARELTIRAAFADAVALGVEHYLAIARAYRLDEDATLELMSRLLDAGHEVTACPDEQADIYMN